MRRIALVLLGAGCNAVFGIDEVGTPDAAVAHDLAISLGLRRIELESNGAAQLDESPIAGRSLVVIDTNGPHSVLTDENGKVTTSVLGPYSVVLDRIDYQVQFDGNGSTLTIVDVALGHADRNAVARGSVIVSGNKPAGYQVTLKSTGIWSFEAPTDSGDTYAMDWADAVTSGPPGLLDFGHGDKLYGLFYEQDPSDSYLALVGVSTWSNGMVPSMPVTMPALVLTARTECYRMQLGRALERDRLAAMAPFAELSSKWSLLAVPIARVTHEGYTELTRWTDFVNGAIDDDVTASVDPAWFAQDDRVLATLATSALNSEIDGRSILRGTTVANYRQLQRPAAQGTCEPVTMTPTVELPTLPSIDGTLIDHEMAIAIGDAATITWGVASPGQVGRYAVNISEITGVNEQTVRYQVQTAKREVRVPAGVFQPGHYYSIAPVALFGAGDPTANQTDIGELLSIGQTSSPIIKIE